MENNIEVFKTSPMMRDGGSIKEILTNIGIFSLKKILGDPEDYFYFEDQILENENTKKNLRVALKTYFRNKRMREAKQAAYNFNMLYNNEGWKAIKIKEV